LTASLTPARLPLARALNKGAKLSTWRLSLNTSELDNSFA